MKRATLQKGTCFRFEAATRVEWYKVLADEGGDFVWCEYVRVGNNRWEVGTEPKVKWLFLRTVRKTSAKRYENAARALARLVMARLDEKWAKENPFKTE